MSGGRGVPPPRIEGMTSLKVDNLSSRTGPADLRKAFEKFGEIGDIHIPRDRWTRDSRGFAFVRFHSRRDAERAMGKMDGRRLDGRQIHIVMARYGRPIDDRGRNGDDYYRRRRERSESPRDQRRDGYRRRRSRSRSRSYSRSASPSNSDSR
uniref:RRM domain-containing protein n=1 Tax=Trichuris muris TaxID=70415 RepID=A0A5S6QQS7_TRIMR